MTIRIVVCLDIDAPTPRDAYALMYEQLRTLHPQIDWESTDEWFDSDGTQLDEDSISAARNETLKLPMTRFVDGS